MKPAIEFCDVSVRRARVDILERISLRIAPGDFLAVLGPNGAGKSTLIQTIPGMIPFDGNIQVLDQPIGEMPSRALSRLRRRIGYVPQLHARMPAALPLSAREVVEIGRAGVRGTGRRLNAYDRELCGRIMEQTRLTDLADRPYAVLSGGEQRKVHLARALAQEPEILLLDEPAGHLDFHWQEAITQLIGQLWRKTGVTVIMVTHDLRHLPPGITRVALLRGGRIVAEGSPKRILQSDNLSKLYELPLRVIETHGRYLALPEESL